MSSPPLPTDYNTLTRDATLVQSGTASSVPVYADAAPTSVGYPGGGLFTQHTCLRYQLHSSMTLNKPVTTGLTLKFDVTWGAGVNPVVLGALAVAVFESNTTEVFTALNIPPFPVGDLTGTGWKYYGIDDGTGWSAATTPAEISVSLGNVVMDPALGTTYYSLTDEAYIFEDANSDGMISLSLVFGTGLSVTLVNTPTLVMSETPSHTGMMVGESELKRKARAVHSYKSGFPYLSDEAVPDGFTDGIMMHPDDYDPIDPVAQGRGDYVPSASESVVDDEVTDLEG